MVVPERPTIVALDGPSGIGKTSIIDHVSGLLESRGYHCGVAANNEVELLKGAIRAYADDASLRYPLALLTAAARAVIRAKSEKTITLSDRGLLSTLVFQGFAGISFDYLYAVNLPFIYDTVFFHLEVTQDILQERREQRNRTDDDVFKRSLPIEEEIARYKDAARFLGLKGHNVHIVSLEGSMSESSETVAGAVERALGLV